MDNMFLGLSPILWTLILYFSVLVVIGFIGYKSTQNLSDYILGGRSFGAVVTALSAGASDMSGWLLMGLPGAIFAYGISKSWIAVGLFLGAWINWTFIAGALRDKTEKLGNAQTLPEYFANRFKEHGKALRFLSAVVIIVFFTFYCASGIVASARLLELSFDMNYSHAIWIGAGLTVSYVFFGGIFAVSWTDTLQAILMFIALLMVPFITYLSIDNLSEATDIVTTQIPDFMSFSKDIGLVALISSLAWGLGYFGQPHILMRFMAAKDSGKTMKNARSISMAWMAICLLGSLSIGYYGAIYSAESGANIAEAESIFLALGTALFNPWVAGFLSAAVLSAIMSTLSSQLLIGSGSLANDILPMVTGKVMTESQSILAGRGFLLVMSVAAVLLANNPDSSILNMVSYAWAGFGASFGSVILLSLLSDKITAKGALAGMFVGAITVLVWEIIDPIGLYSMVPSFALALLAAMAVSFLDKGQHKKQ